MTSETLEFIGVVVQVQVQRDRLKVGELSDKRYDPAPLHVVEALRLTQQGVIGLTGDGGQIIDVHHALHPATRYNGGTNGISFNFTGHYQRMRERFGSQMAVGSAGENILIDCPRSISLETLGNRLVIESASGSDRIYVTKLAVATPCAEFSRYAAGSAITGEVLKHTLQFLDDGMRGFYATLESSRGDPVVQSGDAVYIVRSD